MILFKVSPRSFPKFLVSYCKKVFYTIYWRYFYYFIQGFSMMLISTPVLFGNFFTSHGRLFRPKMVVTIEVGTPTMPCLTSYFVISLLYPLKNITRSKILEHFLLGRFIPLFQGTCDQLIEMSIVLKTNKTHTQKHPRFIYNFWHVISSTWNAGLYFYPENLSLVNYFEFVYQSQKCLHTKQILLNPQ